jgi:hypothetical protein
MLDQEADEPFVRAERRTMDADRGFVRVVPIPINRSAMSSARPRA